MPSITCYADPKKAYSLQVCRAFAAGCGGEVVTDFVAREGIAIIHGMADRQVQLMREVEDWYEIDHAYFGRMMFHRVTHQGLWSDGTGRADYDRLKRFGITVRTRKPVSRGDLILATQSTGAYTAFGMTQDEWLSDTRRELRRYSNRACLIRHKPIGTNRMLPPLINVLSSAWAVAVHSSGSAFEALALGLPVVVTEPRYPAARLATDPKDIETPRYPSHEERLDLFARLASQQWNLDEMESGDCWSELQNGHG